MKIIIVGAGLAGSVSARILADKGHDIQIFETRNHVAGNCYDSWLNNILVHNYGCHVFHTNYENVWNFVNRFTDFNDFTFKVMANTNRGLIPIPFNKKTQELIGDLSIEDIRKLIFLDYSEKHWGIKFEQLSEEIKNRVPVKRANYDDRYFCDKYQGIPKNGYTKMFEKMLDGIIIHLGCEKDVWKKEKADLVIYTGKLDEYFGYCFGRLGYRSLIFKHELSKPRQYCTINECNKTSDYTRSYDQSHWLKQKVKQTIITYEYSCDHTQENEPYYPMPFEVNLEKYRDLAEKENGVFFLGRLANYRYYNMDDTINAVIKILEAL